LHIHYPDITSINTYLGTSHRISNQSMHKRQCTSQVNINGTSQAS